MKTDPRIDPRRETSREVGETRSLAGDSYALRKYWDELFENQYLDVLEAEAEFGRHGVIAEIITRNAESGPVVDAGCGTGILSSLLDSSKFQYLGIDLSNAAIDFARTNRTQAGVEFRAARIEECSEIRGAKVVVFNEVLYYLDPFEGLSIARLWLDEGGIIVVSLFDFPEGRELLSMLQVNLNVRWSIAVENTSRDLKWYIVAGDFSSASEEFR